MPSSRQRRRKGHGEVMPPLSAFERVEILLKEHLAIFPNKPELTEAEIEHWHQDLSALPIAAIEYAFDNWRRNGHFFPLYSDVIELCQTWNPPQENNNNCDPECQARHGKGYHWNDILKLWELCAVKVKTLGRRLTESEWEDMWNQIDKLRGRKPTWKTDTEFP